MSAILNKKFILLLIGLVAIFAISVILFRGFIDWEDPAENFGLATGLPFHLTPPGPVSLLPENNTSLITQDSGLLDGYTLYDSFNTERTDVWIKPYYKPTSTFIDTTFLPSNVELLNGDLVLRSNVDLHQGSEYKTRAQFKYGQYRSSIKTSQTPGTYLAFFLYTPDPKDHNEIDIELVKSGNVTKAIFTTWVNMKKNEQTYVLGFDPSQDYHVYGFDWNPGRVDFYIDDMETPVCNSTSFVPEGSCYLYFNNWVVKAVPANHGDGINAMYVDWVTVKDAYLEENGAA